MEPVIYESFSKIKFKLNNNREIPAVGLGTYRIRLEEDVMKTINYALDAGYRMFDTAAVYGNECYLGNAFKKLLPKYGLERDDIFITTKLSPSSHGSKEIVHNALMNSLKNLGLSTVDMYLIHFPGTSNIHANSPKNKELRELTWAGLEFMYDQGLAKSIGVSNFTEKHLTELLANNGVVPAINQVEWHPHYYQPQLLDFCKANNILLQAYCPLGGTSNHNFSLIKDPIVNEIAKKHNQSCAQVLLLWALQHDVAVVPKSTNPKHIRENINLNFRLTAEDMEKLDDIGVTKRIKYAWNPDSVY